MDKKIPDRAAPGGAPKDIFNNHCMHRPEFKYFLDYKNFASRLSSLRKRAAERSNRSKEDDDALTHDRAIFPKPTVDTKGLPMWQGSKAQELLIGLLERGEWPKKKPKEIYESEEEFYLNYPLDVFRNRIYQENKYKKRQAYIEEKIAKKKAEK